MRRFVSCLLALTVSVLPAFPQSRPRAKLSPPVFEAFQEALALPYLELFDEAAGYEFNSVQIQRMRDYFDEAEGGCVRRFHKLSKSLSGERRKAQGELRRRTGSLTEQERHDLHCRIQNRRIEEEQRLMFARHSVPLAYEHYYAKLDLVEHWPEEVRRIRREIASGEHHKREFGDVADIGFREILAGQEKDVKRGKRAIDEMRRLGMMPKEWDEEAITRYVNDLALKIARRSDLKVPLKVTVLDSDEINAFALPGGFLFVHRGLLEAVEDESQLAGVLAHEMAHVTARHGHRLMKKATIAGIFYQAAQIGAVIFTGGAVGIGTFYALQYGFFGLGLVLSLELLGVSREYELEADQLGVQYAWNSGYDPLGFIRFFDKMATKEGYIRGASWFRTHPPFYERMVHTKREIEFLPGKGDLIVQTDSFNELQTAIEACSEGTEKEDEADDCKPSLLEPHEKNCPDPMNIDYEPGQPIESICFPDG